MTDLEQLKRLAQAAASAYERWDGDIDTPGGEDYEKLDEYWAAAQPSVILELLGVLEQTRTQETNLRGLLQSLEWASFGGCPVCFAWQDNGHLFECELAQALANLQTL